ncbi:MAG: hypothetical protein ABEJ82_02075 [Haloplanus sp.]
MPSTRTGALYALLVVGVLCSFAFHASVASATVTYTATSVQASDAPHRVATVSPHVGDLDDQLDRYDEAIRRPVDRAARTGSFAGNVTPELYTALDSLPSEYVHYVVYHDAYYRWNTSRDENTTFVRIQMTPANGSAVLAAVATPYRNASDEVKTAIRNGSVQGTIIQGGVYRYEGAYYAVAPRNGGSIAAKLLEIGLGYVLTPVGRGLLAVALGVLYYRYREPSVARVLTPRRAGAVALLALPVALVGTAVFESGSPSRFVTGPASAFVVAAGVMAGVLVHQRRWLGLLGTTALAATVVVGANVLLHGLIGIAFGLLFLVVGLLAGVIPLVYGIAFSRDRDGQSRDVADATG